MRALDYNAGDERYRCPRCRFESANPTECPRCGIIYEKYRERGAEKPRETGPGAPLSGPRRRGAKPELRFRYDDPRVNRLALPIAVVAALVCYALLLPRYPLAWMAVVLHELGHAVVSWESSRAAVPVAIGPFVGWTHGELEQAPGVYLLVLFFIGVIVYLGVRHRNRGLVTLAAILLVGQTVLTFAVDDQHFEAVMLFAGIGGEMALSTLLVVGFYYRLPPRLRWDFLRYPALLVGVYCFGRITWLWMGIQSGRTRIPYGTGIVGSHDEQGDMNRLRFDHGWSETELESRYLLLALVCALIIVGHYVVFALRSPSTGREGAAPPRSPGD